MPDYGGACLLLTERGAGGWKHSRANALAEAARLGLNGWTFRCVRTGSRNRWPVWTAILLDSVGSPDPAAMQAALEIAGRRHDTVFTLDTPAARERTIDP